jgi:hypothetical protein
MVRQGYRRGMEPRSDAIFMPAVDDVVGTTERADARWSASDPPTQQPHQNRFL